jgi:hypothetical protein
LFATALFWATVESVPITTELLAGASVLIAGSVKFSHDRNRTNSEDIVQIVEDERSLDRTGPNATSSRIRRRTTPRIDAGSRDW